MAQQTRQQFRMVGHPLQCRIGKDHVARCGMRPLREVGLGPSRAHRRCFRLRQHFGRIVDAFECGIRPARRQQRRRIARPAAQIGDACRRIRIDSRQQFARRPGPLLAESHIDLADPTPSQILPAVRNDDAECGARGRGLEQRHVAAMGAGQIAGDCKPSPDPPGRVEPERLEQLLAHRVGNARPIVGYIDRDGAMRAPGVTSIASLRPSSACAALRSEIENDAIELLGIGVDLERGSIACRNTECRPAWPARPASTASSIRLARRYAAALRAWSSARP